MENKSTAEQRKPCYGKCERCAWFYTMGGCSEWNSMRRKEEKRAD